jgi:hypothetical protein
MAYELPETKHGSFLYYVTEAQRSQRTKGPRPDRVFQERLRERRLFPTQIHPEGFVSDFFHSLLKGPPDQFAPEAPEMGVEVDYRADLCGIPILKQGSTLRSAAVKGSKLSAAGKAGLQRWPDSHFRLQALCFCCSHPLHHIFQRADTVDRDGHHIAGLQGER